MAEIQTVRQDHYAELAEFLAQFPPNSKPKNIWLDRFGVWWDRNPAMTADTPRGYMLTDAGRIVGFIGNVPMRVLCSGSEHTAFGTTTWRVLPEYRNQSMALLFKQLHCLKQSLIFDGTPTPEVVNIIKSLGFVPLPGQLSSSSILIANPSSVAKQMTGSIPVAAAIAAPLASAWQGLHTRRLRNTCTDAVREVTAADESFEDLWHRTRNLYENTNVRTSRAVNWSCFTGNLSRKTVFACCNDDRLAAYIVLWHRRLRNLNVLRCADLWTDPQQLECVDALIARSLQYARDNAFDLVALPHFSPTLARYYSKLGLLSKTNGHPCHFVKPNGIASRMTADNSYFVEFQGDRALH